MNEITYNNGLRHGGIYPRLYLVLDDQIHKFRGLAIDGVCVVAGEKFEKNGKWSNTTYRLLLAPGVRAVYLEEERRGIWGGSFESWASVAADFGTSIDVARQIVTKEYPWTAERLNQIEQFAMACEFAGHDSEVVTITFGSPNRKNDTRQFWHSPKRTITSTGLVVTVTPPPSDLPRGEWLDASKLRVEPLGAQIVDVVHRRGHRGGVYEIRVSVPLGG